MLSIFMARTAKIARVDHQVDIVPPRRAILPARHADTTGI
jgi:hypothetical protein